MGNARHEPASQPSYLDYFGLERPPFARLPEPASIFHAEQYALLISQLAEAKSNPDCMVVVRGVDGSGKTTLLNRYLSCLGEEDTFATIDESCKSAAEFYSSFFQQIGFARIDGKLEELRRITREFLIHRAAAGDPVLIVIDDAHKAHPSVFEQLRWIAEIEHRGQGVFSAVLAGQPELIRILKSPAMADVPLGNVSDFHIRAYTEDEMVDYIGYRLMLVGAQKKIAFTPEAIALLYRFSGGIPRWINRVCGLMLAEACARRTNKIDSALVRAVAEAEQLPANVYPLKRRARRSTDKDQVSVPPPPEHVGERIQPRDGTAENARRERVAASPQPDVNIDRLYDQIAQLSSQLGKVKAEKLKAEQSVKSHSAAFMKLREAVVERDVMLGLKSEEMKGLARSLNEYKIAAKSSESRANRAQNRVAKLEDRKAALQEASDKLRADLRSAKSKAARLVKLEQQLEKSNEKRESLLAELQELRRLRDRIDARDKAIAALKGDITDLSTSDTQTQARLADISCRSWAFVDHDAPDVEDAPIVAFEVSRRGEVETVFALSSDTQRIMIGRGEDCELRLDSDFVSRHHALMFCSGEATNIEDLNSFNGTIVNGDTVTRTDLRPNDAIIIGEFHIRPVAGQK